MLMITKPLFDLMRKSICTQTLLSYYCRMMSKWVAMMVYTVLIQWKRTYGGVLDCTPTMSNRSVWLSSTNSSVNISSPTASFLTSSVYCSWKAFVPLGYQIKVHFSSFNITNSSNCFKASVEIAEVRDDVHKVLGRYCGKIPNDVFSTYNLNTLTVIYTASIEPGQTHQGFYASLMLVSPAECSQEHDRDANNNIMRSGTNGTIQSPLNPLSHNIDTKCRWTITVPSGHRIKLNFSVFNLGEIAGQDTCDGVDYVDVRDSYNDNDPPYGKFCGNKKPSTIYSVGPRIVVTFVSDGKKGLWGFSAKFEAISGGVCTPNNRIIQLNLTQNSVGRLSSPDYPLQLPSVSSCFWRLKAPDGYCVKLSFTSLNIKGECEEEGHREELMRVDDYFTTDFGSVTSFWGHFCKDVQPQVIYSTRNELQIFFTSNYSNGKYYSSGKQVDPNSATGFYGTYQVTLQGHTSRCRTDLNKENFVTLKGSRGSLVSPGYPNSYPIITCTWRLVVPDGHILEMDVQDFEMSCDGKNKLQVGREVFCGSKKPQGLLTSDSDLTVRMVVTESQNNRGFRAEFVTKEKEVDAASIVPWIVVPIIVVAICVTMVVIWRRKTAAERDRRGSSFKASIIKRMRTQSTNSQF